MEKSQHSVIVVPGHKIADWYDRAAERCAYVMIELGSTLTEEQRAIGIEQCLKLEWHPWRYIRHDEVTRPALRGAAGYNQVIERWEGWAYESQLEDGNVGIIESPKGVLALAKEQVIPDELWFGPMDFCAEANLPWRVDGSHPIRTGLEMHAIAQVSMAAKARGRPFVAGPCFNKYQVFEEALEDFCEFGADRKGALDLFQVDEIERAWSVACERRRLRQGSGVAWEDGVLIGPALREVVR